MSPKEIIEILSELYEDGRHKTRQLLMLPPGQTEVWVLLVLAIIGVPTS